MTTAPDPTEIEEDDPEFGDADDEDAVDADDDDVRAPGDPR